MLRRLTCVLAAAHLVAGCASPGRVTYNTSKSQEEAASVHVAVQSIQPWDEARVSLVTNFKLSEAEALGAALPVTSLQEQEDARRIVASLGLAFPTTTVTKTEQLTDDRLKSGLETDSFSREELTTRGEAADPTQPSATRPGVKIPDALRTLQQDPFIQAQTARNLIHYYALLNQEIDHVAIPDHAKAYLVRLQVTVSPNKRRQPYDLTIDLGTFQTPHLESLVQLQNTSPISTAELLPLIITDQVERSMQSQAELVAAQLALSAQGGLGGVGARGSAGYGSESLRAALGAQYNSLYSLAQLNAHTLRIRFGAQSLGGTYETVTRNHLVTFLMIVPDAVAQSESWKARQFELLTRIYVNDARTGRWMDIGSELEGLRATEVEFGHFYDIYEDFALNCAVLYADQHQDVLNPFSGCVNNSLAGELYQRYLHARSNNRAEQGFNARRIAHLARAAQEGDFARFREIVAADYALGFIPVDEECAALETPQTGAVTHKTITVPGRGDLRECRARARVNLVKTPAARDANAGRIKTLYLELQRLRGSPRVSSKLNLPRMLKAAYPIEQSPFVEYDDKTARVRLHGGRGLDRKRLAGTLQVTDTASKRVYTLPSMAAEFDGRKVELAFTSLSTLGDAVKLDETAAWICLRSPKVEVRAQQVPPANTCPASDEDGLFAAYKAVLPNRKSALKDVGALTTTADSLTAVNGTASARVQVVLAEDAPAAVLTVSNATLKTASKGEELGLGRKFLQKEANKKSPAVVVLELENLTPGADVSLTLSPESGVTTHGAKSKTLKVTAAPKS